jgi:hypothetical protein
MGFSTVYDSQGFLYVLFRFLSLKSPARIEDALDEEMLSVYRRFHARDLSRYLDDPDPFALRYVDPGRIRRLTGFEHPTSYYYVGNVRGGDWDVDVPYDNTAYPELYRAETFEGVLLYRSLENHFRHGVAWGDTEFVRAVYDLVDDGERVWHGCESRRDVDRRCERVDALYHRVATHGYEPRRESNRGGPGDVLSWYLDEVLVDVSRDGELCVADGYHRLSIAKLLDLDQIPVILRIRHREHMRTQYG